VSQAAHAALRPGIDTNRSVGSPALLPGGKRLGCTRQIIEPTADSLQYASALGSSSAASSFFGPDHAGNRVGDGVFGDSPFTSGLAGIFGERFGRDFSWETRGSPTLCQRRLQCPASQRIRPGSWFFERVLAQFHSELTSFSFHWPVRRTRVSRYPRWAPAGRRVPGSVRAGGDRVPGRAGSADAWRTS
jgi:hypothetical protein